MISTQEYPPLAFLNNRAWVGIATGSGMAQHPHIASVAKRMVAENPALLELRCETTVDCKMKLAIVICYETCNEYG
jgi:hypothetical protein